MQASKAIRSKRKGSSMKKFLEFLSESNGTLSSTRLFMFLICLSIVVDYQHAVWTVGAWHPDWQVVGVLLGTLGFKVWQKKDEDTVGSGTPSQEVVK